MRIVINKYDDEKRHAATGALGNARRNAVISAARLCPFTLAADREENRSVSSGIADPVLRVSAVGHSVRLPVPADGVYVPVMKAAKAGFRAQPLVEDSMLCTASPASLAATS
jgi:hypothetical protein